MKKYYTSVFEWTHDALFVELDEDGINGRVITINGKRRPVYGTLIFIFGSVGAACRSNVIDW